MRQIRVNASHGFERSLARASICRRQRKTISGRRLSRFASSAPLPFAQTGDIAISGFNLPSASTITFIDGCAIDKDTYYLAASPDRWREENDEPYTVMYVYRHQADEKWTHFDKGIL
jgi:hypothetical protein